MKSNLSYYSPHIFKPIVAMRWIAAVICMSLSNISFAESDGADIQTLEFVRMNVNFIKPSEIFSNTNVRPAPHHASIKITYSYDGKRGAAFLGAKAQSRTGVEGSFYEVPIAIGSNKTQHIEITAPDSSEELLTQSVEAFIYVKDPLSGNNNRLFTKKFDWAIGWPPPSIRPQFASDSKETRQQKMLGDAIEIIDRSSSDDISKGDLDIAKRNLDNVLLEDPNNPQAYLELARIAMKSDKTTSENGRYNGLDEAERLIKVALKINPDYANSYVLFGYVLAVKNQTENAVSAFKKAQQLGTKNMWLYYNWGLALQNAHRPNEAIKKYQEGVALTPMPNTPELRSSNRAIPFIFYSLMELLKDRNDVTAMDTLYKKRLAVMNDACQKTYFGQFKLFKMGDYDAAIKLGMEAQTQNCESGARPLLGEAYLTKWALDTTKMEAKEREQLLNRAQAFISDTSQTIVDLASSPFTDKVLPKLKVAGFQIDALDAKGMTPLAYAITQKETNALKALIAAGANPDVILLDDWTPLMIAVATNNVEAVNVLLTAKVKINRTNKNGQSALSIAKEYGYIDIIKLLGKRISY